MFVDSFWHCLFFCIVQIMRSEEVLAVLGGGCGQFCFGKSPHRHIQEIAAEAAKGKEVAKSSPSCSLFVCASEQSACVRNASGICGLKSVPSSYRSATQKVYRNPVDCRPPAKWRKNLRSSAKRSSCGVAPSKMLP